MRFTTRLIYLAFRKAHKAFLRDTRDPQAATQRLWDDIWDEVGGSKHWLEHRPGPSPKLADFPLSVYNDYKDTIAESYQTGESLLTRSKIIYWGQSSGTTTKIPKVYPVTARYRQQMEAVGQAHTYTFLTEFPDYFFGKALFFVANRLEQTEDDKYERAYMSNYGIRQMPKFLFNRSSVIPRSIYMTADDDFHEWGGLYTVAGEIEYTTMILPSIFHGFWNRILSEIDSYWPYLEGKKALPAHLPPLKCSAARLKYLREVFARDEFTMKDVWPTLHTVFSWRSGISAFQEDALSKVLGDVPVYNLPYCATEGYFCVPMKGDSLGGAVHPGANILEFLPVDKEATASNLVSVWDLKEGDKYELVITTTMGMIRYRMFDIVKCTGFFNASPIIEFVCKAAHVARLNQSNVYETNLAEAIRRSDFTLERKWLFGPNDQGNQLCLYVRRPEGAGPEWDETPEVKQLLDAATKVDQVLSELNDSYGEERRLKLLLNPQVKGLPYDHVVWTKDDMLTTKPRLLLSMAPDLAT